MPQKQERFRQTEITIIPRKNGTYKPSGLGGRSILVVRLAVHENLVEF